jgi:hypothetical protein
MRNLPRISATARYQTRFARCSSTPHIHLERTPAPLRTWLVEAFALATILAAGVLIACL